MLAKLQEHRLSIEEGFTLVELVIVVVVIGILAAIAVPMYLNNRKQAVDATLKADVNQLIDVVDTYAAKDPYGVAPSMAIRITDTNPMGSHNPQGLEFVPSPGTEIRVSGAGYETGGYCIQAWNAGGSKYVSNATAYTFKTSTGQFTQEPFCAP